MAAPKTLAELAALASITVDDLTAFEPADFEELTKELGLPVTAKVKLRGLHRKLLESCAEGGGAEGEDSDAVLWLCDNDDIPGARLARESSGTVRALQSGTRSVLQVAATVGGGIVGGAAGILAGPVGMAAGAALGSGFAADVVTHRRGSRSSGGGLRRHQLGRRPRRPRSRCLRVCLLAWLMLKQLTRTGG